MRILLEGQQLLEAIQIDLHPLTANKSNRHTQAQLRAIRNWLTRYKPRPTATNLNQVKGCLQAFYHLSDLDLWPAAIKVFEVTLNTPTQEPLHQQLGTWGLFSIQQELTEKLLPHTQITSQPALLTSLGNTYAAFSNYPKALSYHQQSLLLARKLNDTQGETQALGNLGGLLYNLGKYEAATAAHQQCLTLAQAHSNLLSQSYALTNLGLIAHVQGNLTAAISSHQRSLTIAQTHSTPIFQQATGTALNNLGIAYFSSNRYAEAQTCHQQRLAIARALDDRPSQMKALGNLGNSTLALGHTHQAISLMEQCLAIAIEIGDYQLQGYANGSLGTAYDKLKQYAKALTILGWV